MMGRAGFTLGCIYQPLDVAETQTFTESTRAYLSQSSPLFDQAWLSVKERGPVRLLYKTAATVNWLVLDDIAWGKALNGTLNSIAWGIDVNTFMRKHLTMFSMEAM